jgi:acyl transferase domain-containing protein
VNGVELYPAAGFIVMAIEAIHQVAHAPHMITGYRLTDVKFTTELRSLAGSDEFETQLYLRPLESSKENSLNEFRICTLENGHWVENCRGTISAERITEDVEVDCGKEAKEERQLYSMLYETGYKKCKTTIASKQLYERLEKIGLSYGPAFQVLDDVRFDGRSATGRVKLRQWTVGVIENHYQKHIVHPTALDGLFQLAFPALIRDVERNLPTMVPDRLQNLWISSRGLSEAGSEYVQAYAAGFSEDMSADGTFMLALDAASKEPLIVARGLQTVAVGGRQLSSSSDTERCRRLCYSFTWKPDIDLLSQQELRAYCKAIENENSGFPLNERIEDLEFICFSFLSSALEELGCMDISKLKPHFQKYVAWMKYQQARYQSGELIHWRPEWEFLRQDKHYFENVMLRLKTSPEGRLYAALGTNLLAILEDRVDVLDLLFSGELAADYYEELAQRGCELLRSYLETLTHKNPSMRILEIGGGTGSTTRSILEILVPNNDNETSVPRYGSYTFTDISAGFFEKATVRFKDHVDRFTFKTLNIEKDPLQQGFLEEKYDLIIASNVSQQKQLTSSPPDWDYIIGITCYSKTK